jgi:hypothetical protein
MPITAEVLRKYTYNYVFVETGTGNGDGVQAALDAGFGHISSFEAYELAWAKAHERFGNMDSVDIFYGDTATGKLWKWLEWQEWPITFFLDAHYMPNMPPRIAHRCPVLEEIKQIAQHPIKTHTVLIDDRRIFQKGSARWGNITEVDIYAELIKIGRYELSYESCQFKEDIIVADFRGNV